MRRRSNRFAVAGMILLALADPGRVARGQAIGPGFELERAGRYADAASVYFTTVRGDPTNIPALLGLERTLFVLNRMPELLPLVQTARARQPDSPALRSLELRVYAALNQPDSLEAIARRWAASAPQSEAPYRSEEHTSELQSPCNLVCRPLLEKKKRGPRRTLALRTPS